MAAPIQNQHLSNRHTSPTLQVVYRTAIGLTGIILCLAASSKLATILTVENWDIKANIYPYVTILATVTEFYTAYHSLLGNSRGYAVYLSLATHGFLLIGNFVLFSSGATCDCLGPITESLPYARLLLFSYALLSTITLSILAFALPPDSRKNWPARTLLVFQWTLVIAVSLSSFVLLSSTGANLARSIIGKGEIEISKPDKQTFFPGQTAIITFKVRNLTGNSIDIIGASTTCSCVLVSGVPFSLPPRTSRQVEVKTKVTEDYPVNTEFAQSITLFLSGTDQRSIHGHITGVVRRDLMSTIERTANNESVD